MKKIIVADDHSLIRLSLIQILKDEYPDIEVSEAEDGISLVKQVMENKYDLVITDIDMPGLNGLQALEKIKAINPKLPVLVLSIYTEDLYAVRVLRSGASGYMNKKSAPYELIDAIKRILSGKKYITPEIAEKLLAQVDTKNPHELLTNKEFEIFKLLASGKSLTQIAESLSSALTTISTHRTRILAKLGLSNNSEITRYAIAHHFISDIDL